MKSMELFTTVTTFLAGFAAADVSGFFDSWEGDENTWLALVWLSMMSFALGNTMYISVVGILTLAAQARTLNQTAPWRAYTKLVLGRLDTPAILLRARQHQHRDRLSVTAEARNADNVLGHPYPTHSVEALRVWHEAVTAATDALESALRLNSDFRNTMRACAASKLSNNVFKKLDEGSEIRMSEEGDCAELVVGVTDIAIHYNSVWSYPMSGFCVRTFPAAVVCFVGAQLVSALRHIDNRVTQVASAGILCAFMAPALWRGQLLVYKMTD